MHLQQGLTSDQLDDRWNGTPEKRMGLSLINVIQDEKETKEQSIKPSKRKDWMEQLYPQINRPFLDFGPVLRLEVKDENNGYPIKDAKFELKKDDGSDIEYSNGKYKDLPYQTFTNNEGVAALQIDIKDMGGDNKISRYMIRAEGFYPKRGIFPLEEMLSYAKKNPHEKISDNSLSKMDLKYDPYLFFVFNPLGDKKDFWTAIYANLAEITHHRNPDGPYTIVPLETFMKRLPKTIKIIDK